MSFQPRHTPVIAPGDELLLGLLRGGDRASDLADLPADVWNAMLARATELAVSPLVYAAVRTQTAALGVPAAVGRTLHDHYAENGLRNLVIYHRARTVLQHLRAAGIAVIVLKGAYLAQAVYRDPALRLMSDVDLLVKAADVDRARDLFHALGYTPAAIKTGAPETLHHDQYVHPSHPVEFELHWALVSHGDPFRIDLDGLWERAVAVSLAGIPVCTLSAVDTVVHLCLHMTFQHVFDRFGLRCLCDLQRVIQNCGAGLDWDAVCGRAEQWGCARNVHLALLSARQLLGVEAPPEVLRRLRPVDYDERLLLWATHRVLGLVDDRQGPWSGNVGRWRLATSVMEKTALAVRMCFPPRQELAHWSGVPSESSRLWLAYTRRWGDLLRRAVRAALPTKRDAATAPSVQWTEREAGRTALVRWLRREGDEDYQP